MSLFNENQNKCITFLINYINSCINNPLNAHSENDFIDQLKEEYKIIEPELIDSILNRAADKSKNLYALFVNEEGFVLPIRTTPIPIRTTTPEQAWIHYILQSPLASLFLDSETKQLLNIATNPAQRDSELLSDYPISPSTIDVLRPIKNQAKGLTDNEKAFFAKCWEAYYQKQLLQVSGIDSLGEAINKTSLIVYKIEYDSVYDSFSLVGYNEPLNKFYHLQLDDITKLEVLRPLTAKEHVKIRKKALTYAESCLQEVTLLVSSSNNGYDRTTYLFSGFERESFHDNGFLHMKIKYYPFQKDELIEKLLFLGAAAKVVEPQELSEKMRNIYIETSKLYE